MLFIQAFLLSKIFKFKGTINQNRNLINIQIIALHEATVLSFYEQSRFYKDKTALSFCRSIRNV